MLLGRVARSNAFEVTCSGDVDVDVDVDSQLAPHFRSSENS